MPQTNERAFETYVEEILLTRGGWKSGSNADWDKDRALFPAQVFAFVQETYRDVLVRKVEEAVERLQEYRTAFITAAVTGKIDVRKRSTSV